MIKKLISSALAVSLVFGSAAVLPQSVFTNDTAIVASAATLSGAVDDTINWSYDGKGKLTLSGTDYLAGADENCTLFDKVKAEDITELVIEDGIVGISNGNFLVTLVNVEKISVADSVTDMYFNPFYNTKWFKNAKKKNDLVVLDGILLDGSNAKGDVVVPDGVRMIGNDAFIAGTVGDDYSMGDHIMVDNDKEGKYISEYTFVYNNTNIKSVKLPGSVKIIGNRAFCCCTNLKKINIPDSIEEIGENAFTETPLINNSDKQQYIGKWLIGIDFNTKDLKIKDGTVGIADYAAGLPSEYFDPSSRWTTKLESVTIPDSVKYIGANAFNRSQDLKSITIPKGVVKIGDKAFESCTTIKKVTVPSNVKEIGDWAFANCKSLTSVKLNEGLEKIGTAAFKIDDSLKSITIPASVKHVGIRALGCSYESDSRVRVKNDDDSWEWEYKEGRGEYLVDGFTLYCYSGTAAHKYAKANKIKYKLLERTSVKSAKVTGLSAKTYTGKAIKPAPTVKIGSTKLKKGIDYTVSYKNNKKIGKATVSIKGKGAYKGTVTKTFKINPKKTAVKKVTSPASAQLKVTYKKVKGVTGYQVTYSTSKKFTKSTTKTATLKGVSKLSKTIKKLKSGKKYYLKVRAYKTVSGKKYYSKYTAVKSVKVK